MRVDDFERRTKAAGWSDRQLREGAELFFNEQQEYTRLGAEADQPYDSAAAAQRFIDDPPGYIRAIR